MTEEARLRELASKATTSHVTSWSGADHSLGMGPDCEAFVNAASPTAILAILDEKAALREAAKNAADGLSLSTVMGNPVVQAAIDRLRAALGDPR